MPTLTSLEDALLWEVCARPDDDLPRLVYADFLEESGEDDRAGFIRRQLADGVSHLPFSPRAAWCAGGFWREIVITSWGRGFVRSLRCDPDVWLRHGPEVVLRQPVLEVTLRGMAPAAVSGRWYWRKTMYPDSPAAGANVPHALWHHLCDFPHFVGHADEPLALRALSHACVRWARAEAGLPPYPFAVVPHST